ncbi:MAG: NAD(P)/FAD-dependent oxidoreductase [Verrucomicrobiota bacterium]
MSESTRIQDLPRVLVVGGGFGGIATARRLARSRVQVGLIDRRNHHLFQPLLYQVATAALNPSDIAVPIRRIFRRQRNVTVALGGVEEVDLQHRRIRVDDEEWVRYDYLVLAAGATHSYFGRDDWAELAPGLKTIEDSTEIRRRFLLAFEAAELENDPEARAACLTFVVVGAGPTGCELAGAMAEIARQEMPPDFRHVDTATARIILVQSGDRVLPQMSEQCSEAAKRQLEKLGVEIRLNSRVTHVEEGGVTCGEDFIAANNVFWAAGVKASPLGESLGVELDSRGRVVVGSDLSVPGHPEVFVIGDQAAAIDAKTGEPVPGVAQGAMQGGDFVGRLIAAELRAEQDGKSPPLRGAFTYFDKGSMATLGRNKAVADAFGVKLAGFPAWAAWAVVHVIFLVSFRSKVAVAFNWMWTYFFDSRGVRLITGNSKLELKAPPDLD